MLDFEGFVDGVAFEGGKGENYPLVIGSGSFIPGFEEQLIGVEVEKEVEVNVTSVSYTHLEAAGAGRKDVGYPRRSEGDRIWKSDSFLCHASVYIGEGS